MDIKFEVLPNKIHKIFSDAGRIADYKEYSIYVVGGFVRDLILGVENLDIDLVVEGDAINFAKQFSIENSAQIEIYDQFQTALVTMKDDFTIDIVTARKEYYEYPAALPKVEKSSIRDDLARRDFTINCMAIKLNKGGFGTVLDYFNGEKDLYDGCIRILHDLSFIDDPTRIFRAVRFENRYGFHMDDRTQKLAIEAIKSPVIENVSKERISIEFLILLKEKNVFGILKRMIGLGLLQRIYGQINITDVMLKTVASLDEKLLLFRKNLKSEEIIDRILLYILVLHYDMNDKDASISCQTMRLNKGYKKEILKSIRLRESVLEKVAGNDEISPYEAYNTFYGVSIEVLFVLCLVNEKASLNKRVINFINCQRSIKLGITGQDLIKLGLLPGPKIKKILRRILKEKINGNLSSIDDELEYARKIISGS